LNIQELFYEVGKHSIHDEVRVLPVVKDDDGKIILDGSCKSKQILGFRVWEGEIVILYEENEECM